MRPSFAFPQDERCPLYFAAANGRDAAARLLLGCPKIASYNAVSLRYTGVRSCLCLVLNQQILRQGSATPLHKAVWFGHAAVVAMLAADPRVELNARDKVRTRVCWVIFPFKTYVGCDKDSQEGTPGRLLAPCGRKSLRLGPSRALLRNLPLCAPFRLDQHPFTMLRHKVTLLWSPFCLPTRESTLRPRTRCV